MCIKNFKIKEGGVIIFWYPAIFFTQYLVKAANKCKYNLKPHSI